MTIEAKKQLVILSHCILNEKSKVNGYVQEPETIEKVVFPYIRKSIGIIQLPCPEFTYLGNLRWGMTKEQFDTLAYRKHCQKILAPIVEQIEEYVDKGYSIVEVVGIKGSPSCGVFSTCVGYDGGEISSIQTNPQKARLVRGGGVYIEELIRLLKNKNITLPIVELDEEAKLINRDKV